MKLVDQILKLLIIKQKRQKQQKPIRVSLIFILITQETKAIKSGESNSDRKVGYTNNAKKKACI